MKPTAFGLDEVYATLIKLIKQLDERLKEVERRLDEGRL